MPILVICFNVPEASVVLIVQPSTGVVQNDFLKQECNITTPLYEGALGR